MSASQKQPAHRGVANPRYAREIAELRRSGASGTHEPKHNRRARTRRAAIRRAVADFDR